MSEMIRRQIEALRNMRGRSVEAGWFESARYNGENGESISVAKVARIQEYGGTINHPGGTKYIKDAIVGSGRNARFVGTRFVRGDFSGEHSVTRAHQIVIPARPFMRLAFSNFMSNRATIQRRLASDMANGRISVEQALGQIGLALEGAIARSIRNGGWTPNAPSTVARKGFNRPLIDSGHMLQSISHIVT